MMNKKMAVIVSILISIQMLSGCAQTSESPIIRVKEVDAMEHYQEAEMYQSKNLGPKVWN